MEIQAILQLFNQVQYRNSLSFMYAIYFKAVLRTLIFKMDFFCENIYATYMR